MLQRLAGIVTLGSLAASGCGLMGLFEEAPEQSCVDDRLQQVVAPCGICDGGTDLHQICVEGEWEPDYCGDDPLDLDHDGYANHGCATSTEACCAGVPLDCNDADGTVHPEAPVCIHDDGSGPPQTRPCTTTCGSEGTETCASTCEWSGTCNPPPESCNDLDDDCDGETDEGFDCRRGASVSCTTTCGTTGVGLCTDGCAIPTGADCLPPADVCNGIDDDCNGASDDDYACIRGSTVECPTTCDSTGTGTCTRTCEIPVPDACTPPDEVCNGIDDDCDAAGRADNGFPCVQGSTVSCTTVCGTPAGIGTCTDACEIPAPTDCTPTGEACMNGIDDDCDTETDEIEAGQCAPGTTVACTTTCDAAGETTGTGTCTDLCLAPAPEDCTPPAESCNGEDDDCDTTIDEDFACRRGEADVSCTTTCGTTGTGTCTDACELPAPADCTPPAESCNAIDDDCDGSTDETYACARGSSVPCTTVCETTGTGTCTDTCSIPPAAGCTPPAESCNAADDDCDTEVDETYPCIRGSSVSCETACHS
ncbi:MAG: hypothetical protein JXB32_04020, partial [Deltaproteobacteria bacterium]|nr:hypothetical protein [Deltaproteobacteria bacterium]